MIFDHIGNLETYARGDTKLTAVVDYLKAHPMLEDGRHALENGAYVNVGSGDVRDDGDFEAHRRYIDLQLLLEGSEAMEYAPLSALRVGTDYSKAGDYQLFSDRPSETIVLKLYPGAFAVFYPQDAHKPSLRLENDRSRKAIFKIPV